MDADAFPVNPSPFLAALVGQKISVKLKWGQEYCGHLVSSDDYMNLHLAGAAEFAGGKYRGNVGEILIRCNNVLYVRGLREGEEAFPVGSDGIEQEVKQPQQEEQGSRAEPAREDEAMA